MKKELDFSNLFSPVWQDFEDRKNKISERTKCFKICSRCGEMKLIFKFSEDKRNLDGRTNICKACRSLEGLKYYYHNRGKILIQNKEYRDSHKGRRSIYSKDYQEKHKEHLKKNARKWYMSNKKAIKKRNLKYYQEHREACQTRRKLWIENNQERIKKYNREYKLKRKIAG